MIEIHISVVPRSISIKEKNPHVQNSLFLIKPSATFCSKCVKNIETLAWKENWKNTVTSVTKVCYSAFGHHKINLPQCGKLPKTTFNPIIFRGFWLEIKGECSVGVNWEYGCPRRSKRVAAITHDTNTWGGLLEHACGMPHKAWYVSQVNRTCTSVC